MPTPQPVYIVGNTHRFLLTAQKDAVIWNLTSAVVTLIFEKPDGTVVTKTATVVSAVLGTAQYTTLATDLDKDGDWARWWHVTVGGLSLRYGPLKFTVGPKPD